MFRSGMESASLTPTQTHAGSYASPSAWRSVSGRRAQLSWCAFRPSTGRATSESRFCCHGGSVSRKRRTSSAVGASIPGCGARSSASRVVTTTWSLPCGYRDARSALSVSAIAGSSNAGTRWRNWGAAAARSSVVSSGSASRSRYAASTNPIVVSIPFQSRSSLNAARALTSSATQKAASQNQPVPQSQSMNGALLLLLGREFEDGLAGTGEALLLAGDLLEVGGVGPEPRDLLHAEARALAQPLEIALLARDLAPDVAHQQEGLAAPHGEAGDEECQSGEAGEPVAHPADRV